MRAGVPPITQYSGKSPRTKEPDATVTPKFDVSTTDKDLVEIPAFADLAGSANDHVASDPSVIADFDGVCSLISGLPLIELGGVGCGLLSSGFGLGLNSEGMDVHRYELRDQPELAPRR